MEDAANNSSSGQSSAKDNTWAVIIKAGVRDTTHSNYETGNKSKV